MNGKFDLDITHKIDKDLIELGYKAFNPVAMELTKICVQYNKKPEEVVKVYKQIMKQILD